MFKSALFFCFSVLTCVQADIATHINIQWPFYVPPYPVSPVISCSQNDLAYISTNDSESSLDLKNQIEKIETEHPDQLCRNVPNNYDIELEAIHSWMLDLVQSQYEQRVFHQQQMLNRYLTQLVFDFADVASDYRMEIMYSTRITIDIYRQRALLFMIRKNKKKNYLGTLGHLFAHMKALDEAWEENMLMKIDQVFKQAD